MANIYLICEGKADGLDLRVLDAIIAQKLGKEVQISAAGGDSSLVSVATWLEEKSRQRRKGSQPGAPLDRAYSIQDRNYESKTVANDRWGLEKKRFMWRRHEIENYLLEPRVLANAFTALKDSISTWPDAIPLTANEIESLLNELADPMIEAHVGWVVYYRLLSQKLELVDLRLNKPNPRISPAAGKRYPERQEWLDYLCEECRRAKLDSTKFAGLAEFDPEAIARLYDDTREDFIANGNYSEDMGGHELMSALLDRLNRQGLSHLSLSTLQNELIAALEREYRPDFFLPDDFYDLANRLV